MSNATSYPSAPLTSEQLEAQGRAAFDKNQKQFEEQMKAQFQLHKDKDGKAHLFGFEVPESVAPALNMAFGMFLLPVAEHAAGAVYYQTKKLAESEAFLKAIPTAAGKAPKIALAAELTTMWGIIAARPIAEFMGANKRFATDRYQLGSEIKSICEATGANYYHNHVINSAYRELHDKWMYDLKMVIPSVIAIVPHTAFGINKQNSIIARRTKDLEAATFVTDYKAKNPKLSTEEIETKAAMDKGVKLDELRVKAKKEFEKKHRKEYDFDDPDFRKEEKLRFEEDFKNHWQEISKGLRGDVAHIAKEAEKGFLGGISSETFQQSSVSGVVVALAEGIAASMRKNKNEKDLTSYDLILKLEEEMQAKGKRDVKKQVVEIFQKLEEEIGNTRFAGGLLEKLDESLDPVAKMISEGRLDPLALVVLAGEDKVIAHSGRKRSFKNDEQIDAAIKDLVNKQVRTDNEATAEAFLGTFPDQQAAIAAVKKALDTLTGDEKDFFVSIMPVEILCDAGMREHEVHEKRKCAHERLYDQVAASVIHFAAENEEVLKNYGIGHKDVEAVKSLAKKIEANYETVKMTVDGEDRHMMETLAAAQLSEQMAQGEKSWADRVAESRAMKQKPDEKDAAHDKHAHHGQTHEGHAEKSFADHHGNHHDEGHEHSEEQMTERAHKQHESFAHREEHRGRHSEDPHYTQGI